MRDCYVQAIWLYHLALLEHSLLTLVVGIVGTEGEPEYTH